MTSMQCSKTRFPGAAWLKTVRALFFVLAGCSLALAQAAQPAAPAAQMTFATAQQAADALIRAAASYDVPAMLEIFGPEGKDFIDSADAVRDKNLALQFADKARQKKMISFNPRNRNEATLVVGNDRWPLPIPLVRKDGKWYFDAVKGREEILIRRIGANELDAIQVCRGYVEAQEEYASKIHDDSGVNQYAQRIISTPGRQDGLYWENVDGTHGGPISKAIADAIAEGYSTKSPAGFHGYIFQVLKGQGPDAPLGELDYVINGAMIGGFALVAVPVQYRVTGVKTFMVSYDGVVYEKDLGPESLDLVKKMDRYNPDKSWKRTYDQWPASGE